MNKILIDKENKLKLQGLTLKVKYIIKSDNGADFQAQPNIKSVFFIICAFSRDFFSFVLFIFLLQLK